jgi:DNA invertase Pin-like site-specific DNA recombinase
MQQGWEVYNIYSDDDYAGSDRKRPEFNRLLKDAEQRRFDIVLCKTQSRFTRELELVEKYIHGLFPIWGIRFISIVDNADTANKGNKKSRQINGLVNEWYLEDLSENIRSVLANKRENGLFTGAFCLYGYKKDPDKKGHLIIDEEAAAVVREVFNLFASGYGKSKIAQILNDKGIPNPTEYKHQHGLRYKQSHSRYGTLWKYFAISDMLTNEMYIGNMVQGKYGSVSYKSKTNRPKPKEEWVIVEGTHEPIIDKGLWDRVQTLIKQRSKPFDTGELGLFAKKARCAFCGYVLRSNKLADGRRYLQCPNHHFSKEACKGAHISVERLEGYVIEEINRLNKQYLDMDELERRAEWDSNLRGQEKKLTEDILAYKKKLDEYSKALRDLYMDKSRGIIPEQDYINISKSFADDKARIEHAMQESELQLKSIKDRISSGDNRRQTLEKFVHVERLSRDFVDTMIDYIEVERRIPGTHEVPITIHWKF